MSKIKFECAPFTRLKDDLLRGTTHRSALFSVLREMFHEDFEYSMDSYTVEFTKK